MNISRRTFLTGLTSAAILLSGNGFANSKQHNNPAIPTVEEFDRILQDSYFLSPTAIDVFYIRDNLLAAYQLIKPTCHVECAIVAWAALRRRPVHHLEEYCRRRDGASSNMFDHKVLDLNYKCLPYTHRILFFREQVYALVEAMIDRVDGETARKIWLEQLPFHIEEEIGLEKFIESISAIYLFYYPSSSKDEITHLYHLIQASYESSLPYSLCSGIVGEALRLRG